MTGSIVTIGKQKYVVGLYWENCPDDSPVKAAKAAMRGGGQRVYAYTIRPGNKRKERIPQFGLWHSKLHAGCGLPALAPNFARQQTGSWAGAFLVSGGVVVMIGYDDLISPDGDMFYPDAASAQQHLTRVLKEGRYNRVYAPKSWNIQGSMQTTLAELVQGEPDFRLKSRGALSGAVIAVIVLALVLVVLAVIILQDKPDIVPMQIRALRP